MFGRAFPLSTRTNSIQSSITVRWRSVAVVQFVLLGTLCGACSVVYDSNRKQCARDSDCAAHGLADGMCVENVCQMASIPGIDSSTGDGTDAGPTLVSDASTKDAGGYPPVGSGTEAGIGAGDAGRGNAEPDSAAPDTGAACEGAGCPECATNEDCELRGVAGGVCADSKCWPPATECDSDDDCTKLGSEYVGGRCLQSHCRPNPRWRCEPPPPAPTSGTKELKVLVRHSLSLEALKGVHAKICPKLDLQCSAPLAEVTTGDDGYLVMTVPANFAGYLQIEAKDFFPAMYFLPAAFPTDGILQPYPLLPGGLIGDALAFALGAELDPTRGHMMLISEDCMGMALAGVSFSSPQRDEHTVQFYVQDLLPSPDVTETGEIGNGGYLNFPAGTAVISVKKVAEAIDLNTVSVVVRPGFISVAYIRPELR